MNLNTPVKGECDCCPRADVEIVMLNGMKMCSECRAKQESVMSAEVVIVESRKNDSNIAIDKDIYNAMTVSFVELQAAIEHDETVPADQKRYRLVEECALRIKTMDAAIFADKAALAKKENERYALLRNTQDIVAKLRTDQRDKFKQFDVNYQPAPITKKNKSTKSVTPTTKSGKTGTRKFVDAVYAAAKKYDVPVNGVQSLVVSRNMSAEDAAKHLVTLLK